MELDVRPIPRARKHSTIFSAFAALSVTGSLTLINDHDPLPLRDQFDVNYARAFTWDYLESGPNLWRVRITKTAGTPLPQVIGDLADLAESDVAPDLGGAIWKIPVADRDLDSNLIRLPAGAQIAAHAGPELDVLFIVVAGTGTLRTELDDVALAAGEIVFLPRRSRRSIIAGADGLRYLTIHRHKTGLQISPAADQ